MSYSDKIKDLRKQHNLTQSELADKLFVSRQAVSLWEQGKAAPSKDTLMLLKELYGISVDEWIADYNSQPGTTKLKKCIPKRALLITSILLCIAVIAAGIFDLASRAQILYPEGYGSDTAVTRKESISITQGSSDTVVFSEIGKPQIRCNLPANFEADPKKAGYYLGKDGTFLSFSASYGENVFNPLLGSVYQSFYEEKLYDTYMEMANYALYMDLEDVSLFSKRDTLHLAGGARILRAQLCAGQDTDYYPIDGGLTQDGKGMRLYGIGLHFDDAIWLITLEDHRGCYYYITIKDPEGIGKSPNTISAFLSSLSIDE